jgi:hypothetical protein
MVGKCEQQRSLIIGSLLVIVLTLIVASFNLRPTSTDKSCAYAPLQQNSSPLQVDLEKPTEEFDKSFTVICYTALGILAMYVVFGRNSSLLGP